MNEKKDNDLKKELEQWKKELDEEISQTPSSGVCLDGPGSKTDEIYRKYWKKKAEILKKYE